MDERKNIAESVRSGRYFAEARDWYKAVYLSPVSGRTMFLLIAVFAVVVALIALLSVTALLPISRKDDILIAMTGRMDDVVPSLIRLNPKKQDNNQALLSFYVQQFVVSSETWVPAAAEGNAGFVKSHAADAVYAAYAARTGGMAVLGDAGARTIQVTDVKLSAVGDRATVRFTALVSGSNALPQKSQWTAKLKYTYTPLKVTEKKGDTRDETLLDVTDPQFQVTEYAVENR